MNPNINFILGNKNNKNKNEASLSLSLLNCKSNNDADNKNADNNVDNKNISIEDKIISHIRYIYITYNYIIIPFDNNNNVISISPIELQHKIIDKIKTPKIDALILTPFSHQLEKYLSDLQDWNAQIINIMILFNKYQISNKIDKCNNIIDFFNKDNIEIDNKGIDMIDMDDKDINNNDIKEYLENNSFLICPVRITYDSMEEVVDLNDRIFIYLAKLLSENMSSFKLQLNQKLYIKMCPYFKYD